MRTSPSNTTDHTHGESPAYTVPSRPPTWRELQTQIQDLAAAHPPDLCDISTMGTSRNGESLPLLTVHGGPLKVAVAAGPHPNEPIGFASLVALARYVLTHPECREIATWYLIPSTDPDGAVLNEHWWARTWPPSLDSYHRGFYRPAVHDQPEWTFPAPGFTGQLPETQALMTVLDTVQPDLLVSLHNSDTGGAYFMTTRGEAALVDVLSTAATRNGLPLEKMPSDCIGWQTPGPGVFVLPDPTPPPDPAEAAEWTPAGSSSAHYVARHGGLGIFPEVPMWRTTPASLPTETGVRHLENAVASLSAVLDRLQPITHHKTPYLPAVTDTMAIMRYMSRLMRDRPADGENQDLPLLVPLRASGMLLRHIDSQLEEVPEHPLLHRERSLLAAEFKERIATAQAALRPECVPLRQTVSYQLDTIFGAVRMLAQ
ncbi:M14 family zinc carboxypeptidase [Streptomyces sp. NPDC058268]|uniref:M14 family zinc carboxypeptidase n=1 Tax=Streptomyces sp. NPDC058268 TaxID=3346413 RepID=UPI0036ED26F2